LRQNDISGYAWRTLGLMGAGRGTGVTHLAVWAANYLTSVKREKTAVLEWNDHGDFMRIGSFCEKNLNAGVPYEILNVDYYPQAGAGELADCLNGDYQYIIMDYGEITKQRFLDCSRCDKKVIVGSLSEWQAEAFLEIIKEGQQRDKSWQHVLVFGSEETRKELEKRFRISVRRVPASMDAFVVTHIGIRFFTELLQD